MSFQSGQTHRVHLAPVLEIPAQRRESLCQPEPRVLPVGKDLFQSLSNRRQDPCLPLARPGPALAEDCLEDVADRRTLRAGLRSRNQVKPGSWGRRL